MKPKQIIKFVLLLFVGVSLATVAVRQLKNSNASATVVKGDKTIVYFFHGNKRCKTCNNMERYTRLALDENFAAELQDGSVELQLVNLDASGNGHYVDDYNMDVRVVVLSKIVGGKETKWRKLERVWELAKDEEAFKAYVSAELSTLQKGEG